MKVGFETKGLVRRIEKIPAIYKTVVILVLIVAILAGLIYFFAMPEWDTRDKLIKEYDELQKQLDNLKQIERNLAKHRKEYQEMQVLLEDVVKQLPETKDIPNLLRSVTSVSEETRLKVKFFEPKEIKNKEFYSELPFEIKFSGPFNSTAFFFDGIRKMDRIVNITNFSLEAKGTGKNVVLEGSCSANAYVYMKERPKTQSKGDKKAGVK
jgi:type IV pilus assembly protein PilO